MFLFMYPNLSRRPERILSTSTKQFYVLQIGGVSMLFDAVNEVVLLLRRLEGSLPDWDGA